MKVYATALKPKSVVITLYLGNDIGQAATEDYPCADLRNTIRAGKSIFPANVDPHFNVQGYQVVAAIVSSASLRDSRPVAAR
jgi:hypothetical protein